MLRQVLVIIDLQNDFTRPEGHYARRHPGMSHIAAAKEAIRRLLGWWGKEPVIVVQSDYRHHQFGEGVSMCIPGTWGHQLDKDLPLGRDPTFMVKGEHSAFSSPPFRAYLEQERIDTLVVCGFLAEYCVRQTARDALETGYTVHLPVDGIGTGDDVQHRKQQVLQELEQRGAVLTHSTFYQPR